MLNEELIQAVRTVAGIPVVGRGADVKFARSLTDAEWQACRDLSRRTRDAMEKAIELGIEDQGGIEVPLGVVGGMSAWLIIAPETHLLAYLSEYNRRREEMVDAADERAAEETR